MITLEVYLEHLKSMLSVLQADLDSESHKLEHAESKFFTYTAPGSKIRNDYQRVLCSTKAISLGILTQLDIFNVLLKTDGFDVQEYVNKNLGKFDKNTIGSLRLVQHFVEMEYKRLDTRLKRVKFYIQCSPIETLKLKAEKEALEVKITSCYNWVVKLEELWDVCTIRGFTDKDIGELNEVIINFGKFKKQENEFDNYK